MIAAIHISHSSRKRPHNRTSGRQIATKIARNWRFAFALPSRDGFTIEPSAELATPLRPNTTISRAMITKPTQADARPTATSAIRTPVTSTLSAVVSRKAPSCEVRFHRRASRPSTKSVMAASAKSPAAVASVRSPPWSTKAITMGARMTRSHVTPSRNRPARSSALLTRPKRTNARRSGRQELPHLGCGRAGERLRCERLRAIEVDGANGVLDRRDGGRAHRELFHTETEEQSRRGGIGRQLTAYRRRDPRCGSRLCGHPDQPEHGRMEGVGEVAQVLVAAVGGERVLREVVRPDREEGGNARQVWGGEGRCGDLDHDPDLGRSRPDRRGHGADHGEPRSELLEGRHHREHE